MHLLWYLPHDHSKADHGQIQFRRLKDEIWKKNTQGIGNSMDWQTNKLSPLLGYKNKVIHFFSKTQQYWAYVNWKKYISKNVSPVGHSFNYLIVPCKQGHLSLFRNKWRKLYPLRCQRTRKKWRKGSDLWSPKLLQQHNLEVCSQQVIWYLNDMNLRWCVIHR